MNPVKVEKESEYILPECEFTTGQNLKVGMLIEQRKKGHFLKEECLFICIKKKS